jgi:hypothetical protein
VKAVAGHGEALRSRVARVTEGEQSSLFAPTHLETLWISPPVTLDLVPLTSM